MDIFKSKFTLGFKDKGLHRKYTETVMNNLIQYNLYFSIYCFAICFLSSMLVFNYTLQPKDDPKTYAAIFYSAIVFNVLGALCTVGLIVFKLNYFMHKVICYLNCLISYFAYSYFRYYIYTLLKVDLSIFYLMHFLEFISRALIVFGGLLGFLETIYISILLVSSFIAFYSPIISWWMTLPYSFIMYIIYTIVTIGFSYFISREKRRSFYYDNLTKSNIAWYENIFDKSNSGFLQITGDRIIFANKTMRNNFFTKLNHVEEKDKHSSLFLKRQLLLSQNFDEIIKTLFENTEYDGPEDEMCDHDAQPGMVVNNTDRILKRYKDKFIRSNETNFILLGNKAFSIQHLNTTEDLTYEIHYRYYLSSDTEKDNFEFIFNDITRTREIEKKNAEFKYKALFFAKVAHEFKNPLICLSELAESCLEVLAEIKKDHSDKDTIANSTIKLDEKLKIISNYSKFLIILTKDLDYFSSSQVEGGNKLSNTSTNIDEVLKFVGEITNGLLIKYNKQSLVHFSIHQDPKIPTQLFTDEIKLNQVLINLCSNAIKFINQGKVTLDAIMKGDRVEFVIDDTGIGISNEKKEALFRPFSTDVNSKNLLGTGLGLNIVVDITKKFGYPVQYSSVLGEGTKFWFSIPINSSSNISLRSLYKTPPTRIISSLVKARKLASSQNEQTTDI